LSVSKLPLKCAVVSLYSVVKQRLKCNTRKMFNCLIQFLITMVLSIEDRVFVSAQRLSERTGMYKNSGVSVVKVLDVSSYVSDFFLNCFILLYGYVKLSLVCSVL
jgi:hypothetical protein